jgi:hypothetical protein
VTVLNSDEVVGTYTAGSGTTATQHGFTWRPGHGVNDEGDLVGFYTDSKGNTDGLFALP